MATTKLTSDELASRRFPRLLAVRSYDPASAILARQQMLANAQAGATPPVANAYADFERLLDMRMPLKDFYDYKQCRAECLRAIR